MSTIPALDLAQATAETKDAIATIQADLGVMLNLVRVAANSLPALNALKQMRAALAHGRFNAKVRTSIALAIAQANGSDYCLSLQTALGKGFGLSETDIALARTGDAADPHVNALTTLAVDIVHKRGHIGTEAVARANAAGVSDDEIVEIIGHIALNVFTNYLNIVAETEIDFPIVRASDLGPPA
jgi:AhpD family alkylhydroperoxidase